MLFFLLSIFVEISPILVATIGLFSVSILCVLFAKVVAKCEEVGPLEFSKNLTQNVSWIEIDIEV